MPGDNSLCPAFWGWFVVKFVTSLHLSSYYDGIFVTGNILYAASIWGLEIFDISAPAKPSKLGEVPTPGGAHDVYVSGNHAYVGIYKRYQVVDITEKLV